MILIALGVLGTAWTACLGVLFLTGNLDLY